MAKIDTISLSGDTFKNIGTDGIVGVLVSNTDTTDVTLDLVIGPKTLHGGTATTNAVFILKDIPIPVGSTFVWDDDSILANAFKTGSTVTSYQDTRGVFTKLKDNTFLIRLGSGHTADITMSRS